MNREYFSIVLSSELNLAIPLDNMGAVIQIKMTDICTVPGVANFWYGAINFKGSLLWVLDTNCYFELGQNNNHISKKLTAVIVKYHKHNNSKKLALVTPKLNGIIALDSAELKPAITNERYVWSDCCSGIFEGETESTFILNFTDLLKQLQSRSDLLTV